MIKSTMKLFVLFSFILLGVSQTVGATGTGEFEEIAISSSTQNESSTHSPEKDADVSDEKKPETRSLNVAEYITKFGFPNGGFSLPSCSLL